MNTPDFAISTWAAWPLVLAIFFAIWSYYLSDQGRSKGTKLLLVIAVVMFGWAMWLQPNATDWVLSLVWAVLAFCTTLWGLAHFRETLEKNASEAMRNMERSIFESE